MSDGLIVLERYAKGLYQVAEKSNRLGNIASDLKLLLQLIHNLPKYFEYIAAPITTFSNQRAAIKLFTDKCNFDKITENFLLVVCQNKKLGYLSDIIDKFFSYHKNMENIVEVEIKSAVTLSDQQVVEIRSNLEQKLKKKIELNLEVSPEILGGLIIRIGMVEIDNSVANRLSRFKFNTASFY